MNELRCPKCESPMKSYERNRVHVDQCTGCGGLFLDRGELEALVAAENAWHAGAPAAAPAQQGGYGAPPVQGYDRAPRYATSKERKYGSGYGHGRRKSFLSELFD